MDDPLDWDKQDRNRVWEISQKHLRCILVDSLNWPEQSAKGEIHKGTAVSVVFLLSFLELLHLALCMGIPCNILF